MGVLVFLVGIAFCSVLCMASYGWAAFAIYSFIKAKNANKNNPGTYSDSQIKTKLILLIASLCAVAVTLTLLGVITFFYAMAFVV